MGAGIKYLTGSLTYAFHTLARTAAVAELEGKDRRAFVEMYRRIFNINLPLMEAVMDAKKDLGTEDALQNCALTLQSVVNGEALDPSGFAPFLSETQMAAIQSICDNLPGGTGACRATAFGTIVAAGQKLQGRVGDLISDMLNAGITLDDILPAMQRCASGDELCYLPMPEASEGEDEAELGGPRKPEPVIRWECEEKGIIPKILSITVDGERVFKACIAGKTAKFKDGSTTLTFVMAETWRQGKGRYGENEHANVRVRIPFCETVTDDGHVKIGDRSCDRMFRPRFHLRGTMVVQETWLQYLMEALLQGVKDIVVTKGRLTPAKAERKLAAALRSAIQALPESSPQLDAIQRHLFDVVLPTSPDAMAKWAVMEGILMILPKLAEMGFDILCTSKGAPGTFVAKSGPLGVPQFLLDINPFALYLDPKRRPEPIEIKKALTLARPQPPHVRVKGCVRDLGLTSVTTNLVTAIFDCNDNVFERRDRTLFCHDTLLCTESAVEKLKLGKILIPDLQSEREVEEWKEKLQAEHGILLGQIRGDRAAHRPGGGPLGQDLGHRGQRHARRCGQDQVLHRPHQGRDVRHPRQALHQAQGRAGGDRRGGTAGHDRTQEGPGRDRLHQDGTGWGEGVRSHV
jgi:hypothetical protein